MNKRNSILESLSEGMLQTANVKRTKNGELFVESVLKIRGGYYLESFSRFFEKCIVNTASKYTDVKSTYGNMYCNPNEYPSIECGDCSIYFKTNDKDEIYVYVENPYSNDYTENQLRNDNVLIFRASMSYLNPAMSVRELVDVVDGRFSKIDKYVDWIHDYLIEGGYNYVFDTHGFELVTLDKEEEVLSGAYTTFSVCVGDEFFDAFTDGVLDNVLDAKAEVYLAKTYSKLKLPTIGCRLTVTFSSSKDAKDFLSSVSGIKSWVNTVTVKGKSLVIEVY